MDTKALDVHKALADDTRFRLHRYLTLAGRPVSVRELARRLTLHPNTLRPHLRRLEEAGLISRQIGKPSGVGRPQTEYRAITGEPDEEGGLRLLAEMLCGLLTTKRDREKAEQIAREWGEYLVSQGGPKPGIRLPDRRNLAVLQEAMAKAGFDPRFRRDGRRVEVTLRECPFRDLAGDHRDLVCGLHRGLVTGMLEGLKPRLALRDFKPFVERAICRFRAAPARSS